MNSTSADRPQRPRTFTSILRHVARRPLLITWLVALAVFVAVFQSQVPQPWSGLIYVLIMPVGVISIVRSLDRNRADEEDPAED